MADHRPPAFFIADAPGIDFLNSIAHPVDKDVEWLANGEDFLAWLQQAKLVPADAIITVRANAVPGEIDAVAAQARALREWFRAFVVKHMGKPLRPDAVKELSPLNRVLQRDEGFGQVVMRDRTDDDLGESGLAWQSRRRWRSPDALLLPVAQAIAEFVCTEDFTDLKACEGQNCTLFFLDRTRGRARRWCSMAVCGNRAKQTAHRQRALAKSRKPGAKNNGRRGRKPR
jgi:predicted RNA-binding Zn ribbon-like protein